MRAKEGERLLEPGFARCMLSSKGGSYLASVTTRHGRDACARCSQDACWWRHRGRLSILHSIVVKP